VTRTADEDFVFFAIRNYDKIPKKQRVQEEGKTGGK